MNMHGYRSYNMENHQHDNSSSSSVDQKPLVVDLISTHYGKPQTPPPSPNGKFSPRLAPLSFLALVLIPRSSSAPARVPVQPGQLVERQPQLGDSR